MSAFTGLEILHHFVSDFQTCELDDADEFIAVFPDLPLSKTERHVSFV